MSSDSDQHSSFLPAFSNVSDMAILFLCYCCQLHTKPPITSSFHVSIIVWKEPRLSLQTVSLLLSAWPSLPLSGAHYHPSSLKTVQSNTGSGFKRLEVVRLIHYQTQLSNFISIADPAECAIELRTAKKKGHFLRHVQEMKQPSQGALGTPCGLFSLKPRVVFRLNTV